MHETFANGFYRSRLWRNCRDQYAASKGGLCERCLARGLIVPGAEVHHKTRLTPENLTDPNVSTNWENLELLCEQCHHQEHRSAGARTDPDGHVAL